MECVCISLRSGGLFNECTPPPGRKLKAVDGGDGFSIGALDSGDVVGWGRAFYGELAELEASSCAQIELPEKCSYVVCGCNHVLAVMCSGRVFAWGWNRFGQVATAAHGEIVRVPTVVQFSMSVTITAVAAGGMHSLAVDSTGRAWSWGSNDYGQLGLGPKADRCRHVPTPVALPSGVYVEQLAAGFGHSAVVSRSGGLFTFGWGLYNQLGHGSTQDEHAPTLVDALQGLDSNIVQVACGNWHTAALTASGDLYTWGWGRDGQLGYSSSTQVLPRVVTESARAEDIQDVDQVACGARFTLGLCRDGSVQWWGQQPAANDVDGRVDKVSAGHSHALLLQE